MSEIEAINIPSTGASSNQSLPRSTPEQNGIASSAIHAFLDAVQSEQLGLHSFMLLRHGRVVAEAWWSPYGPERPHAMFSISKNFTSTAIGMAVSEGLLSVDDPVVDFFPDKKVNITPKLQAMRVRHLLTMTTGHSKESLSAVGRREDWVEAILNEPLEHEPGTFFLYNNGASYILSAIFQQLTGQTLHEYLQPRLLQPLGIAESTWLSCPRGVNRGGTGLFLKTEDIAKFGQLYLQRGNWKGQQLVPEAWVEEATSYQVSTESRPYPDSRLGYGYQFWRSQNDSYRGAGARGQYCLVLPEQDAVIAITAGSNNGQGILDQVWKHLLPAMEGHPLPLDENAQGELVQAIANLSYPPLDSVVENSLASEISGKRYLLDENKMQIQAFELHFESETCQLKVWNSQVETAINCGIGRWAEGVIPIGSQRISAVTSGGWRSPAMFVICRRMLEAASAESYTLEFDRDGVRISFEQTDRPGTTEAIVIQGKLE